LAIFDLLNFPLTKFVPVKFGFQDDVEIVLKEISDYCDKNGVLMINDEAIKQISQTKRNQYGFLLDIDVVQDLARAYNTKQMLTLMPEILMQQYVNKKQEWGYVRMGTDIFPISPRFISSWAIDNNIVGYSVDDIRSSAVMSHIHTYFLFDLDQVNTVKKVEERKNQIEKQFGSLDFLFDFSPDKEMLEILKTSSPEETMAYVKSLKPTLKELYENFDFGLDKEMQELLKNNSPEEAMDYVKSLKPTLKELYEKVDGNWERFTVEEHTEAVLRIFEDNYAKELPQDLLPFCKLLILVHDMGKGIAAVRGNNKDMTYTLKYSRMFCESFKQCSPAVTELIYFMVAESQKYTSNYYIRGNESAIEDLKVRLKEKCEELEINASEDQIMGLTNICKMFQACDSGAYTFYGVTRDSKTGQYYNNGNERFTYSFENPHGISNRRMKLKDPLDDQPLV